MSLLGYSASVEDSTKYGYMSCSFSIAFSGSAYIRFRHGRASRWPSGKHRRVPQAAMARLAELGHLSNVLKTVYGDQLDE